MTSLSSGSSRCTILVSRIASSDNSVRCSSGPLLAAYPSLKMRYSTCSTVRNLSVCSLCVGIWNGTPDALIRCFALAMRCAMVASGTRNAFAISAVVSPPTARKVSAIAEAGVSAGWQHMNSTINVSSWSETSAAAGSCSAVRVSRFLRDCSLRS